MLEVKFVRGSSFPVEIDAPNQVASGEEFIFSVFYPCVDGALEVGPNIAFVLLANSANVSGFRWIGEGHGISFLGWILVLVYWHWQCANEMLEALCLAGIEVNGKD